MSGKNQRLFEIFLDVHRGLPRQGPGAEASTLEALAWCTGLPERPVVLDIGCGPGMQTVTLSQTLTDAHITALDLHQSFLHELKARVNTARVANRIDILVADMHALPFSHQSFDLIWVEGAAYIMGFEKALIAWKPLLKTEGYIAMSELVWLHAEPPTEVADFFAHAYPAMTDIATNIEMLQACGYELSGHFTLPDPDWWVPYYTPLEAKLPSLYDTYADDEDALGIIETAQREIEMRRRFGNWYGYEFFIGRNRLTTSVV
jgi:SAM-dependent methyltransferase